MSQISKKAKDLKAKADAAFAAQKWNKALSLYNELDEEAPNDTRVLQRIGDLNRKFDQKEEAITAYKRVAQLYTDQGFWAKAIAMNKIVLDLDPSDLSVQKKLAKMCSSQGAGASTDPGSKPETSNILDSAIEQAAISIAGAEPRYIEAEHDAILGNTVSLETESAPLESNLAHDSDEAAPMLGPPKVGLKGIPLFSDLNVNEFNAVLDRLSVRRFPKQSLVCEEGDLGRSMFIVSEGVLEVFTKDSEGKRLKLGELSGGEFFGEFGLITNGSRNASVQALTDVELLEITSTDFDVIANQYPRIWSILEEYVRRRMLSNIFTKSPVFRVLSMDERNKLIGKLIPHAASVGDIITPQGTEGDEMYFIKSGTVTVLVQKDKEKILVGELGAGEYFGEVAMLTGKPRTATIQAKTDCELFKLNRKDAASVLKGNTDILLKLRSKMDERARDTIEAYQSYLEAKTSLSMV